MVGTKVSPNFFKVIVVLFSGLFISYLGFKLRLKDYAIYPVVGDTYDEHKAPFNGIGLLRDGIPTSWSWYPNYTDTPPRYINGGIFRLVKPWFDEPPLFSLMAGAYGLTQKIKDFDKVDIYLYRHPMVYVNAFNILLLFFLIYLVSGFWEAVAAGLIYASVPTMVLSSRLPISDNMVATFTLISLLFTVLYLKTNSKFFLFLLSLFSALSLQLKSTGVYVPVACTVILWSQKKFKPSMAIIFATIVSLILWFAYGYYYNWNLFLAIMQNSSGRELFAPTVIINLLHSFRIGEKVMGIDGWIIWGWIATASYCFLKSPKKQTLRHFILPITIASYLVFFSIMSGHVKGWYRLPFYPLIAWASGSTLVRLIKSPSILPFFFFVSFAFFSSYVYGHGGVNWNGLDVKVFQYTFVSLMAPFMLYQAFRHNRTLRFLCQLIIISVFILSLYYNYQTIMSFQDFFYYRAL